MTVAQAIGSIPAWLQVGPVVEFEGLPAREVLGDWSHLHEWDRPPQYVREGALHNSYFGFDRSEARPKIKQIRPGKPISELKGIHSGTVAILFNGASLVEHDLWRIAYPIIGINRTHRGFPGYEGPQPDYLCLVDLVYFDHPKFNSALSHPKIINGSDHKVEIGWRATRHPRMSPFSFDLERDGYAGPVPATTGHLALQSAVYMGFTEIHCVGWDLHGDHFNGAKGSMHYNQAAVYHRRQAPLLRARGVNVFVCGSPDSRVQGFEHSDFEALCR